MPRFRILHISDPHFCVKPNRKNRIALWQEGKQDTLEGFGYTAFHTIPRRRTSSDAPISEEDTIAQQHFADFFFSSYRPIVAEQVARFAHYNRDKFDGIVCTGDLSTTGLSADLSSALHYFARDPQWGQFLEQQIYDPLNDLGRSLVLMPGNHDRYKDGAGAAGGVTFDLVFDRFWPAPEKQRVTWDVLQRDDGGLAIIAADFALNANSDVTETGPSKQFKIWGQGKCHDAVLAELEGTTVELRQNYPKLAVVWAIHFPPAGVTPDNHLALRECEKLKEAVDRRSIGLLLTGHLHRKLEHELSGCRLLGAGSCCAVDFESYHWIHIVNIETHDGVITGLSRDDYKYSLDEKMFVKDGHQEFAMNI